MPPPAAPPMAWDAVSGSAHGPRARRPDTPWGLILGGAAALVLLLALGFWWFNRSPGAEPREPDASTQPDTAAQQAPAPAAPVELPETLRLVVTGRNDGVQEMRVTVDDDVRRPYWIEVDSARAFSFINQIIMENQLQDATLEVQGRTYPTSRTDERGRVIITRDTVQRLLQQR